MIKKKIIIMPIEGSWNHSADFFQQTAITLSKNNFIYIYDQNNHYFFLKKNKIKSYPHYKNINFYQVKYYLPFERFHIIDKVNRYLSYKMFIKNLPKGKKVLWIFYPNYCDLAKIKNKNIIKIYDCVDYSENKSNEKKLINNVDYFFVNSIALKRFHQKQKRNAIYINSQGFYQLNDKKIKIFKINKTNKKAIIGYVGGINYRLNYPLINKLIVNHPEWLFVFYGPEQKNEKKDKIFETQKWINKIKNHTNTLFGLNNDRNFIYGLIKNFDLAIIPYNTDLAFNLYCYPMKIFEYFYLGKPIISSGILEFKLKKFNKYIKIANNYQEWEEKINESLRKKFSKKTKIEQRQMAIENSWQKKINKILNYID